MTNFSCYFKRLFKNYRKMSTFIEQFNPVTGKLEWKIEREDYDFQQEVARSAYADMLHDWERNLKYHNALKSAIDDLRKANKPVRVLDIGTGSGLLAMMAAKYGADSVYACEAFKPVAECAKSVIADNMLQDKIKLIQKRSTDLKVGPAGDLPERANLLVTEVFDTELIGEGALTTFKHALENLLTEDCVVIPSSATVYAQVVQSSSILAWHSVSDFEVPGIGKFISPESVKHCAGIPAVHDFQLSELSEDEFLPLTSPVQVKKFDFTGVNGLKFSESSFVNVDAIASGKTEVIFMWWDIEMYPGGDVLSCAPKWAHPEGPEDIPWRDHWMQAVYYSPQPVNVAVGDEFFIGIHHDEYSFWFSTHENCQTFYSIPAPACTCGVHVNNSRSRIGMMNDHERYSTYVSSLTDLDSRESKVVFVCGESIPLALIACKLGFKKVFLCETQLHKIDIIYSFAKANQVQNNLTIIRKCTDEIMSCDLDGCTIDVVLAEPFFPSSVLQWDSIHFWYMCMSLKKHFDANVVIIPSQAVVYGLAAQFKDLWKIRAPVKTTESFDLTSFDHVIQSAIVDVDFPIEPQPLWEYPAVPLSEKFQLCTFNFNHSLQESSFCLTEMVNFNSEGTCNGIALWVEFVFDNKRRISLGPTQPFNNSNNISWYRYSQQGVHILPYPQNVANKSLRFKAEFSPQNGNLSFDFKINDA